MIFTIVILKCNDQMLRQKWVRKMGLGNWGWETVIERNVWRNIDG